MSVSEELNIYLVVTSINDLEHLTDEHVKNIGKIRIVDEGEEDIRSRNSARLKDLNLEFYGPRERDQWFRKRFKSCYRKYLSVIPEQCHAESSSDFLIAWEEGADAVIQLDDDAKPLDTYPFVEYHLENVYSNSDIVVYSEGKWYNTPDNVKCDTTRKMFPRSHPFDPDTRIERYTLGG